METKFEIMSIVSPVQRQSSTFAISTIYTVKNVSTVIKNASLDCENK